MEFFIERELEAEDRKDFVGLKLTRANQEHDKKKVVSQKRTTDHWEKVAWGGFHGKESGEGVEPQETRAHPKRIAKGRRKKNNSSEKRHRTRF